MKKIWYVSRGNTAAGPFEESVILSLRTANIIGDEVFLWKKGMKNWDFAGNLFPAGVTEAADNTAQAPADDRKPLKLAVLGIGVTAAAGVASSLFEEDDSYTEEHFASDIRYGMSGGGFNAVYLDTSGEGIADAAVMDINNDGFIDTFGADLNHDGILDSIGQDLDGDGILDVVGVDIDQDGVLDAYSYDLDGDGDFDMNGYDVDGDGTADYFETSDMDEFDI